MAHNKSYRSFIILQEDEKGHSMAADKPLTGYAKIETKNDKCRVSFYAQNLKKEYKDCCIMLICNKKDFKKNINLGPMNISQHGKAEMNIEYDSINIGDLNISYDKIVGAAIGKEINGRMVFFMYGFLNGQMPKDNWKNYEVKKINTGEKTDKTSKEYKYKKDEDDKKVDKKNKDDKKLENKKQESLKEDEVNKKYDEKTNKEKSGEKEVECENVDKENKKEIHKKEKIDCKSECGYYDEDDNDYYTRESCSKENRKDLESIESLEKSPSNYMGEFYELESRFNKYEESIEEDKLRSKKKVVKDTYEVDFNNPIGEVLAGALHGCEKVAGFAEDIKRCAWYKVDVDNFDDMCNMSNYNKYTMMYYPMINYYPYISKKGHFFFGIKCDMDGEIKYMLYAIPGTKDRKDQPYGGRTGFVTWDKYNDEKNGYWIMFYDFENSSVVIPMK